MAVVLGSRLEQPGRQLRERTRQSGEVQDFDETPCGADFPCRSRPEESAQLVMHRCMAVLWHGLEAPEQDELVLCREHTLYGLGSERPDQLVLEIGDAREETERFQGLVGGDRNGRVGESAADVPLVGDVIHATEFCTRVCAYELRKHPREVRYAISRPDLDVMQAEIAADAVGQRVNSACIAVALDEHQGIDGCRVFHACGAGTDRPRQRISRSA